MNQDLIVYVCGRRSGMPNTGIEAIQACAHALRKKGLQVVSPIDVNVNFLAAYYSPEAHPDLHPTYPGLRADIFALLSTCNAIALMPGWDQAIGCRLEVCLAITFGYYFIDWQTGEIIVRPPSVTVDKGYGEWPSLAVQHSLELPEPPRKEPIKDEKYTIAFGVKEQ